MEVVASVLAGLVGLLVIAIVQLILGRVKGQDEKIDKLATKEAVEAVKRDLEADVEQLRRQVDGFNQRHTDKNHAQDAVIRAIEQEQTRQGVTLSGIRKSRTER